MFALMVGVIVGTYSSLFVASPIMLDTISKTKKVMLFIGGPEIILIVLVIVLFFGSKRFLSLPKLLQGDE